MSKAYPSNLTSAQFVISGLIPAAETGGRPREVNICEILNAIFYVLCAHDLHSAWSEHGNELIEQDLASLAARPNRSIEHPIIVLAVPLLAQSHRS